MDSFEINKIVAAILIVIVMVVGIDKLSDVIFHVDKPEKSAYKVDIQEGSQISNSIAEKIEALIKLFSCN